MKKMFSFVLALAMAFASAPTTIAADVQPVTAYTVTVGKTYRLPEDVKQTGDTYSTSDEKVLTVEADSGRFTAVSAGSAYIVAANSAGTRYVQVTAVQKTLEERINGLTLNPQPRPKEGQSPATWYDYSRVEKIRDDNTLTSYEKMRSVFLDIAQQTKGLSCTSHTSVIAEAYKMLGFQVYGAHGGVKARPGYSLEERTGGRMGFGRPGYTSHTWLAVEIDGVPVITTKTVTGAIDGKTVEYEHTMLDTGGEEIFLSEEIELSGEILFFDVNLYSTHGMGFDACFAVPPQNTALYYPISVNSYY